MGTDGRENPALWPQEVQKGQVLEETLEASATWSMIFALVLAFYPNSAALQMSALLFTT